jgi:ATP sulfurylase
VTLAEQMVTGARLGLPHRGVLVDRRLGGEEAAALAASRLPALWLTAAEQMDLRALASGAYSPLVGFPGPGSTPR